jgi:hypothetical protein
MEININAPKMPWWRRLWRWITGKSRQRFGATVGPGGDYPTVQAAIDAGVEDILLLGDRPE